MKLVAPSRAVMVGVAAAAAVLGIWYQLLWSPQTNSLAAAHRRIDASATALIASEQRLGHLKKLSSKSTALDEASAKLISAIPDHDAADAFILDINNYAAASGVAVSTIGIAQPSSSSSSSSTFSAAGVTALPLQLAISGGYFDVENFLRMLRDGPRLVVIDSVSLSAARATGANGAHGNGTGVSGSISARLFMVKGATAVGANPPLPQPQRVTTVHTGSGVLETPINAAKTTANAASADLASQAGGTP